MKSLIFRLLVFLSLWGGGKVVGQTTAVDYSGNDCSGQYHHFFSELDSGKIIVISFVMPCSGCVDPSLAAFSVVQQYNLSYPGKVVFYLSDDDGLSGCSFVTSWGNSIGISHVPVFADTNLVGTQYGSPAMPKIVVLGGLTHHVFFVQDNGLDTTNLKAALNSALAPTEVAPVSPAMQPVKLSAGASGGRISVSYEFATQAEVKVALYDMQGAVVMALPSSKQSAGSHSVILGDGTMLSKGIYILRLTVDGSSYVAKVLVD
jgi:hypothetical protein